MRKMIFFIFMLIISLTACNQSSTPEPTATISPSPTITITPTHTTTSTPTITPSPTPIPPTPTPTQIEDFDAFKRSIVAKVTEFLEDDFNVLDIEKVEIVDNTLIIEIVTTWGSVNYNGETAYFINIELAKLLIEDIGEEQIFFITDNEGLSISYKSLSIHYNLEFRFLANFAAIKRLASEDFSIPEWVELTDAHFP